MSERDERIGVLPAGMERWVPAGELELARAALGYVQSMLADREDAGEVAAWCYDFAAAGAGHEQWAELALARAAAGGDWQTATRDALILSQLDLGENETLRQQRGGD